MLILTDNLPCRILPTYINQETELDMAYDLSAAHLKAMFNLTNFPVPEDEIVFVGLRGTSPVDVNGTEFSSSHKVEDKGIDYLHMRCSLLQLNLRGDTFAIFPGSTVPHIDAVKKAVASGGEGVNQLASCFLGKQSTLDRRYYRGDHGLSSPLGPHRAFRNDNKLPIWRTSDDVDYEGTDKLRYSVAYDNIHCARQPNVASPKFSSNGCQVIAGVPGKSISSGIESEQGPWRRFVKNAYEGAQTRFCYALFEEGEAQRTVELGAAKRSLTVRFGSQGELVSLLQSGLISAGYDVGPSGPDGDFGYATLKALRAFQLKEFGNEAVDLIAGPITAERLGVKWPSVSDEERDGAEPLLEPSLAVSPGKHNDKYKTTFSSLYPGGFFSSDPDDTHVKRAIRTNNPGALNITQWQKEFPGFVGQTFADSAGNKTTVYRTPEHGVGAWLHLLTNRYRYGDNGVVRVGTLAKRYAGASSEDDNSVKAYLTGWKKHSDGNLVADSKVALYKNPEVLVLAKAMFCHEIGGQTPLSDKQIVFAVDLKRSGKLPA